MEGAEGLGLGLEGINLDGVRDDVEIAEGGRKLGRGRFCLQPTIMEVRNFGGAPEDGRVTGVEMWYLMHLWPRRHSCPGLVFVMPF